MTSKSLFSIALSSLLLTACGGSYNSSSETPLSPPPLPEAKASFSSDRITGVWLLSYEGMYETQQGQKKASPIGKVLLPLTESEGEFIFNDCLSYNQLDLNNWPLTLDNNKLVASSSSSSPEIGFEISDNNQFSGTIKTPSTSEDGFEFKITGVKVSSASNIASAAEIITSMTVTDGTAEHSEVEFPLDCMHYQNAYIEYPNASADEQTDALDFITKVRFQNNANDSINGEIYFPLILDTNNPDYSSAITASFPHQTAPIEFQGHEKCEETNECTTLYLLSDFEVQDSDSSYNFRFHLKDESDNTALNHELTISFQ